MADIKEIIDLYAEIPTFHPDYKPIIDKMPPSLVKRAFDQLLKIKCNPVLPKDITEKSNQIEQYLRNKLIVYEQAKNQKAFVYSMDTEMQIEDVVFLIKQLKQILWIKQPKQKILIS
ncbi:11181_t:CDS:1 [Funneliformis caledonium]|uniref:11181_t:CDS:1 n=1 Tax=Funneliformis caledonium TaxID=1117310 RepID=A0A9N9BTZ7_9GLOM|nr:11181_t:CDS:1 [Funneliformis caledonium]